MHDCLTLQESIVGSMESCLINFCLTNSPLTKVYMDKNIERLKNRIYVPIFIYFLFNVPEVLNSNFIFLHGKQNTVLG